MVRCYRASGRRVNQEFEVDEFCSAFRSVFVMSTGGDTDWGIGYGIYLLVEATAEGGSESGVESSHGGWKNGLFSIIVTASFID